MKRWVRNLLVALGVLLAAAIVLPLVIPIPPAGDTRPPRELAYPDSQIIEVNGLEVHVQQSGNDGLPLVLLHGFGASTFSWHEVRAPLAVDRLVVAYDRPGFGLTERPMPPFPGDFNPYSQSAQVDLLLGLMDTLGIERAVLVGNSAGGTISLLTALDHPERVAALVLVDPGVYAGGGGAPSWARFLLRSAIRCGASGLCSCATLVSGGSKWSQLPGMTRPGSRPRSSPGTPARCRRRTGSRALGIDARQPGDRSSTAPRRAGIARAADHWR